VIEINKTYCCDNLELMKKIPDNFIDLIYCDILFGTGNKYKDYQDIKANKQNIEDFYIPRIKEMYRVLKETGSIYIHCDQRINHWIRCIFDDIFGYDNFRNEIIWCYDKWVTYSKNFQRNHDNILRYSKTKNFIFNIIREIDNKRKITLERGYTTNLLKNGERQLIIYKGSENKENIKRLIKSEKFIRVIYKKPEGNPIKDYWIINKIHPKAKERTGYPTQKPEILLNRVVNASSNKNDLVADFFCGSGTTLVVAKKLGRNFIGCDISEEAIEITNKRLAKIKMINKFFEK